MAACRRWPRLTREDTEQYPVVAALEEPGESCSKLLALGFGAILTTCSHVIPDER